MSGEHAIPTEFWREAGGRNTGQRSRIVEALGTNHRPVTAQELYMAMRSGDSHRVSLATVYRTLKNLSESGIVDVIRSESGEQAYMLCTTAHHHHLSCVKCGRVVEVTDCRISDWAKDVARQHGFAEVEHSAELTGICAKCTR